jgi:hypothetical protein
VERFALAGYDVEELIGFGGTGEVWLARETDTGEPVALKRLRARGPAATERLRREAGLLATLAGPHVVGVRRFVVDGDEAVMVMDHAAGGNLASLLDVRGRLPAPEVVTIAAPIAVALAAAHSRDLVHGDITPGNILFTADGRPLLADLGIARALGVAAAAATQLEATVDFLDPAVAAGGEMTPASDVFALGAVAFTALAGHPLWGSGTPQERLSRAAAGLRPPVAEVLPDLAPAVAAVLDSMLDATPDRRPDARRAGHSLLRSSAVAPVGLVHTSAPVAPPPTEVVTPVAITPRPVVDEVDHHDPYGSPWRRRIVVGAAAVLGLAGAMGVGVSLAHTGRGAAALTSGQLPSSAAPATTSRPTAPAPVPWFGVVSRLESLRASAFERADPAALANVYAPGAPAYQLDLATVRSLQTRGLHAAGLSATVQQVRLQTSTATTATLRVVDRLSGYTLVTADGAVEGRGGGRPDKAFTMRLSRVAGAWRVAAVTAL